MAARAVPVESSGRGKIIKTTNAASWPTCRHQNCDCLSPQTHRLPERKQWPVLAVLAGYGAQAHYRGPLALVCKCSRPYSALMERFLPNASRMEIRKLSVPHLTTTLLAQFILQLLTRFGL
jgi:hypothetical protein